MAHQISTPVPEPYKVGDWVELLTAVSAGQSAATGGFPTMLPAGSKARIEKAKPAHADNRASGGFLPETQMTQMYKLKAMVPREIWIPYRKYPDLISLIPLPETILASSPGGKPPATGIRLGYTYYLTKVFTFRRRGADINILPGNKVTLMDGPKTKKGSLIRTNNTADLRHYDIKAFEKSSEMVEVLSDFYLQHEQIKRST